MMDDRRFDLVMEEELADLPLPDADAAETTPWKRAMSRIVWGIGLTTCTLNFLYLNYLLPAIGVVLLVLGFRTLRKENRWFAVCWGISIYQVASKFVNLVLNATLWQPPETLTPWMWLTLGIPLIQYLCLWKGIREVRRAAGQPDEAGAAAGLAVWYVALCALAIMKVSGWLFGLPLIVVYFLILRNLYRMSALLDGAGYQVRAAQVRVSETAAWIGWFVALVAGVLLAGFLFGRYPMEWTPRESGEQAGLEEIRDHLMDLGFPDYVLDDLTVEDLAQCEGAIKVTVESKDRPMNAGRKVSERRNYGTHAYTTYDVNELKVTTVVVALSEYQSIAFHHFLWQEEPDRRGMECIRIATQWCDQNSYRMNATQLSYTLSGRVLCDRDGEVYTSPFYSLGREDYTSESWFFGAEDRSDVFAEYSHPRDGERCRGYIAYHIQCHVDNAAYGYSILDFVHQRSWLNYPARTPKEHRQSGGFRDETFWVTQHDTMVYLVASEPAE